jgi:hypothetical protein
MTMNGATPAASQIWHTSSLKKALNSMPFNRLRGVA